MLTLYKLTDENDQTFGKTQWGEGATHSGTGKGELCAPGWIHAYTDPLLPALFGVRSSRPEDKDAPCHRLTVSPHGRLLGVVLP